MALGQDQEAQSVKKETRRHVYSLLQIHQHLHPRKGNAQRSPVDLRREVVCDKVVSEHNPCISKQNLQLALTM